MSTDDTQKARIEHLAPHDESGFGPDDCLNEAEMDDEVIIEFEVPGEAGVYRVEGLVANVDTTLQDDERMEMKIYHLESSHILIDRMKVRLLNDTESAYCSISDKVGLGFRSEEIHDRQGMDIHTVEVKKYV